MHATGPSPYRVGLGEDRHRTEPGGPLRIGGIHIPHDQQLVGHSDADVLLHAVTDALLGAAGLPDIGQLFPNSEAANRHRDSSEMLQIAYERVRDRALEVVNLDCVVTAEAPKLAPHRDAIRGRIAELLGVSIDCVNVKAKTAEGLGEVGLGGAIDARVVVLLMQVIG